MSELVFIKRSNEEVFAERATGVSWRTPNRIEKISGKFYFTDQRIVFLASWLIGSASVSWELRMDYVVSAESWPTPSFVPFGGILLTTNLGGHYEISVFRRKKYIEWINRCISSRKRSEFF